MGHFLRASGIEAAGDVREHGHFIPVGARPGGFVRDHILLAGDAAGLIDPVTGEGITYALSSGLAAARALITGGMKPQAVREAYYGELKVPVLRELGWGRLLASLLYRSRKVRNYLFQQYGQQLAEAMGDVVLGRRTYADLCRSHLGLRRLFRLTRYLRAGTDRRSP
jgi:flavin-dependent dehydrogenase